MSKVTDLTIIGAGPIGLACGIACKKSGLSYVIIEKGCLVNSLYNYPSNMTFFSTSERLEIGDVPFTSLAAKPSRAEALEYYRRVTLSYDLNVNLFEEVLEIQKLNGFLIKTTKETYQSKYVIIATGFYDLPNLLGIKGEEHPKVRHYYNDPHFYAFQDICVVGSRNSAVDVALETYRKGAKVTMVVREAEFSNSVKYWAKPDIENRIAEGSIRAYFESELKEISDKSIIIKTPNGNVEIENDWVLAMTGYKPNLDFLEKSGIILSDDAVRKPHYDHNTMETNIPNIFIAGVIGGGMNTKDLFIENSRIHAEMIVNKILKG